jgi:hypothetical protein
LASNPETLVLLLATSKFHGFEATHHKFLCDFSDLLFVSEDLLVAKIMGPFGAHNDSENWLREPDLNRRPSGYEPDELPGCSIPRLD